MFEQCHSIYLPTLYHYNYVSITLNLSQQQYRWRFTNPFSPLCWWMTIKTRQLYCTAYANLSTSKAPQSSAFRQCVSPIFLYLSDTHSLAARNWAHTQIFSVWYDVDVYIFENYPFLACGSELNVICWLCGSYTCD